ncbi:uncharacterized protein N7511_003119 [Penicillium nucicola]|uniref:uncharacterized protein n=1 Tax=Penicillium nucicola TaxID=1850975 RepID=UPI0025453713|nr:uncharacterized protein N7511_003119 [Penicillium nucicola]KAJ5771068.1 hypothetical protein N7511_003119 [Penicillium nucicola]
MSNTTPSRRIPPGAPTEIGHSEEDIPPGPWALYLMSTQWSERSVPIAQLQSRSPQRELQTRILCAEEIEAKLGILRFVTSALIQIVGLEAATQCIECLKGEGPWPGCKVVPGSRDGSCANCKGRRRCSLLNVKSEEDAADTTRTHVISTLNPFETTPNGADTNRRILHISNKRRRPVTNDETNALLSERALSSVSGVTGGQYIECAYATAPEQSNNPPDDETNFRELWMELAAVENPPVHWDMHVTMGNMEKLRLDWSQNEVAASVVESDLSSADSEALKDALKKLSPKVQAILGKIKSEEDSSAVRDAICYLESLRKIKPKIVSMKNGPVKEAYLNLYSHFDSVDASKPTTGTTEICQSQPIPRDQRDTVDSRRYETPQSSSEVNETRLNLLESFQKEGTRLSQAAESRRQSRDKEWEEQHCRQKEVDQQLRRELDSQSPKIISGRRRVSNDSRTRKRQE